MGTFHSPACVVIIILDSYVKLINPEGDSLDVTIEVTSNISAILLCLISVEEVIISCLQNQPRKIGHLM
jgi:hypothetical protein